MAAPVVGIVGAKALRKDLSRLADDVNGPLYKAIRQAGLEAVAPIVPATRAVLPHVTGRLADTVRASGTRTGGNVRMGRVAVPYAGWVEFGGSRPDGSEREYLPAGRYLFPTARDDAGRAAQTYSDNLSRLFDRPDIWTNSTTNPGAVHD